MLLLLSYLKNQIKNALFLFGKFGNFVFARIPFEIGRLIILFSILQFAIWLLPVLQV